MFRNVYKSANDCIKGDREILDRAFLQAAQPEKTSSPILKYSVVGTAVAAVVVAGAIFMNSELFLDRGTDLMPITEDDVVITGEKPRQMVPEGKMVVAIEDNIVFSEENDDAEDVPEEVLGDAENEEGVQNSSVTQDEAPAVTEEVTPKQEQTPNDTEEATPKQEEPVLQKKTEEEQQIQSVVTEDVPVVVSEVEDEGNVPAAVNEEAPEEMQDTLTSTAWSVRNTASTEDEEENTGISEEEAVEMAKLACTVGYDTLDVEYDEESLMWTITFSTNGELGGCQSVVVDNGGVIRSVTYGE